ncbi:MAG: glycerophosphodiester phosphodiesterase [Clostridia bacterium]|nr:glycerophosphodiester phosphodiesterase [Clostridia bacterium]
MSFSMFIKMFTAFIMSVFTVFSSSAQVKMIGHRGHSMPYPENTAMAFEQAAKHGFAGAETDVRVTSDGVYVTNHNSSVVLKDGTKLEIADNTYETLTAQPLKQSKTLKDVYLCTFKEYLEIMRDNDMICFIELKGEFDDEQINEIFTLAGEVYTLDKCILQSFEFENLVKAHEQFPDLRIMLTYGETDKSYVKCFEYGFSIDADYAVVDEEMVEAFHSRGLEVAAYTANELFVLSYLKSLGVDYIESDLLGGAFA